jgi:dTDP-4-amino-4,6-dideoxygalactose transaminase
MSADVLLGVYPPLSLSSLVGRPAPQFPFTEPALRLTHLGRGAVWLALQSMGLGPGSRLAMPAYHCGSEVEAARLAGLDITFYRVDASLRVDQEDLARAAARSDATYLISYFGFPPPAAPPGTRVIQDVAHGLFSSDGHDPLGSRADAAVFCPRKTLGVPDGGAVLCRSSPPAVRGRPPWRRVLRSAAAVTVARAALAHRRALRRPAAALLHRVSRAEAAVEADRLTETVIGQWDLQVADMQVAAREASRLTAWLVDRVDADAIRARRRDNYAVLAEAVPSACPEPFRELPPGVCPLYFPVRVADRATAIARLQARGIRAVEVWPLAHPLLDRERFGELEPLRRQLLALPVHQDLQARHMQALVRAAREVITG